MTRDLELCKRILEGIEKGPIQVSGTDITHTLTDVRPERLGYHVTLLCEAGLLTRAPGSESRGDPMGLVRLTWAGHEFLDQAREPQVWTHAKEKAGALGFDVFKEVLKECAIRFAKSMLGH